MPNDLIDGTDPEDEELEGPPQPVSSGQAERRARLDQQEQHRRQRHEVVADIAAAEAGFEEAAIKVANENRRGLVRDLEMGVLRGTLHAVANASALVQDMSNWLDENVADLTLNNLLGTGSPDDPGAAEVLSVGLRETLEHDVPKTERITGMVAEPIQQYVMGFMLTRRAGTWSRNGQMLSRGAQVGVMAGRGAVADFTAFHEHQERLSNMIQANPWLANPVSEFLAADENDSAAMGRLKNTIEGAAIGGLAEGLFIGIRAFRGWRNARAAVKKEAEANTRSPRMDAPEPEPTPLRKEVDDLNASADRQAERTPGTVPREDGAVARVADDAAPARPPPDEAVLTSFRKSFDELRADPLKLEALVTRIRNGDWSAAEEMVGFNIDFVDLRALAGSAADDKGEGIRRLINTVAEELEKVLNFGPVSWDETGAMADTIFRNMARRTGGGVEDVKQFFDNVTGGGGLAARYLAAERWKYGIAKAIREQARKGLLNDVQGELGALEMINLMGLSQAMIRGAKGEAGRLLNSMKTGRVFSDMTDEALREAADASSSAEVRRALMHKLANTKNLEELTDLGQRTLTAGIRSVLQAQFIQGLLSGPGTLVLNTFSNSLKTVDEMVIRAMAVPIGATREAGFKVGHRIFGKTYKGYDRETWGSYAAFMRGSWQGLRMSLEAPVAEIARGLIRGKPAEARAAAQRASAEGRMGTAWTAARYKHTAYGNPHEILGGQLGVKTSGAKTPAPWEQTAINWTTGYEYPLRGIIWGDDLHKSIAYHQSVASASVRTATHEAKLFGHDAAWAVRRAKELEGKPTSDMIIQAHKDANYATFQSPLQIQIFKDYERMLQNNPELRLITPFFRTPAQLIRQGVDRTPVGLVRGIAKNSHEGDKDFARGLLGSMTMVAAYTMYQDGRLVGSRRNTLSTRNSQDFDGVGSYSVKPTNDNRWVEVAKFDPLGFVVGMTADYFEMMEHWQNSPEEKDFVDKFFGVMASTMRQFADKSWFQGITDVIGATTAAEGDRTRSFVTSKTIDLFTPYQSLGRRLTLREQEFMTEQHTVLEQLYTTYGFLFSKFGMEDPRAIKHDQLGRPMPRQTYLGGPVMSPVRTSREYDDVVSQEIARAAFEYSSPARSMNGIKLDSHDYNRWLYLRGQVVHGGQNMVDVLETIVTGPWWPDMTRHEQEEAVKEVLSDFGEIAKDMFLAENDEFRSRWRYHQMWPVFRDKPQDSWPDEYVQLERQHLERAGKDSSHLPKPGDGKRPRRLIDDVEAAREVRTRTEPSDWSLIIRD